MGKEKYEGSIKRKEWHFNNRERRKELYKLNKNKIRATQKRWELKNKDKIIIWTKQYKIKNKDKIKEYFKQYHLDHKDYFKFNNLKRTSKISNVLFDLNYNDWLLIKKRDNNCCVYCGNKKDIGTDHIIPVTHKGEFKSITSINNLVLCCLSCNASKNNYNVFEWFYKRNKEVPNLIISLLNSQIKSKC